MAFTHFADAHRDSTGFVTEGAGRRFNIKIAGTVVIENLATPGAFGWVYLSSGWRVVPPQLLCELGQLLGGVIFS